MPFVVQANVYGLTATAGTAKEALATAVEWHVVEGFVNVTINDGNKSYTIAEFSLSMALLNIADIEGSYGTPRAKPKS